MIITGSDGTPLTVDSSNAARATLYDSSGRLITRPKYAQPEPQIYSYMCGMVNTSAFNAANPNYIIVNTGGRRMRIRQALMEVSEFNANAAEQHTIQMRKAKFPGTIFTTGAGAVLPATTNFSITPKVFRSPASVAMCLFNGGILTGSLVDSTIVTSITIPGRTTSRALFDMYIDEEEPAAGIILDALEALIWIPIATVPSNAFSVHLDWDEEYLF